MHVNLIVGCMELRDCRKLSRASWPCFHMTNMLSMYLLNTVGVGVQDSRKGPSRLDMKTMGLTAIRVFFRK